MKSSIAWHNHRKICMNFIEMQCSINMRSCMILVYSVGQQPFSAVLSGMKNCQAQSKFQLQLG